MMMDGKVILLRQQVGLWGAVAHVPNDLVSGCNNKCINLNRCITSDVQIVLIHYTVVTMELHHLH